MATTTVAVTREEAASMEAVLNNRGGDHDREQGQTTLPRGVEPVLQPVVTDRITVALIPKAGQDLQRLRDRTSLSKTDLVNRAITLYEFIEAQQRTGRDLLVRDSETGEIQTVLIL